jgi:hypothetical protein
MKVDRAGYLAFALTVCGYAATAVSATQATQAYTLESTKVSANDRSAVDAAGQITIKSQSRQGSNTQTASPRLDAGPAVSLPQTGIAGQQLTVINQTRRAFQKWVYTWVDFSGGGSGWTEVHREATYCGKSKDRESLCTASGF